MSCPAWCCAEDPCGACEFERRFIVVDEPAPADAAPVPEPRPCCERVERETVAAVVKMLRTRWDEYIARNSIPQATALRIFADDLEREGVRRG